MRRVLISMCRLALSLTGAFGLPLTTWAEPGLSTAGASFAPMDAGKAQDPNVPLSSSQVEEIAQQFKGLIAMGEHPSAYRNWGGRSMSDCEASSNAAHWCGKCDLEMPDAFGEYYFYPDRAQGGSACTLQEVDVHVKSSEEVLLKEFRTPLQKLFGSNGSVASDTARHWETDQDIADLYIDRSKESDNAPYLRFLWRRAPLIHSSHMADALSIPSPKS